MMVVVLTGCGAADSTDTEHAPLPPMEQPGQSRAPEKAQPAADRDCPLALSGAQMVSEVTADGVALVFTTSGGDAAELQARVHQMAEHHNEAQVPEADAATRSEKAGDGMTAEGAHGMDMHGAAREVPSRAAVEDIAGGARIVFTPSDPAKVGLLREQIRVHGKEMASSNCSQHATPAAEAPPPPQAGERKPPLAPTPTPGGQEPIAPDRPKTPDQPVTPPAAPPPPTGQPFGQ